MTVRIAIDCMGGDHGLPVTVPAALAFARSHADCQVILVGIEDQVREALKIAADITNVDPARISVRHASQVISMDESPAIAMRTRRDSSMRVAIDLVKAGEADAAISAGNTGALMAISRFVLKTLAGIDRPAIAFQLPNQKGGTTTMLDLGANVDCEPHHYLQFAIMGAALVTALDGKAQPSIGLLNIGEEVIKGNEVVKQAAELLRVSGLNFIGNVEGDDIFFGTSDVVVCDGFVGNVALKTTEGLAKMLGNFVREEFKRNLLTKIMGLLAYPVLTRLRRRVDPGRYNGGGLVGLRGIVVKSHGSADAPSFEAALRRAYDAARNQLVQRIADALPNAQVNAQLPAQVSQNPEQI